MRVAFVMLSYRRNAPAGIERATAAHVQGLRALGHQAFILAAGGETEAGEDDDVVRLSSFTLPGVCDDEALRAEIEAAETLASELDSALAECDVVVWCDALWGLGAWAPRLRAKSVLMVHVLGVDLKDLRAALARAPDVVIAVSESVVETAQARGIDSGSWRVVPNALLAPLIEPPSSAARQRLRTKGGIHVVARLGPEKGVAPFLLAAAPRTRRNLAIALADAPFEPHHGSQPEVRAAIDAVAAPHPHVRVRGALPWHEVPAFFAAAAIAVVPSLRESFGLVALEAMSAGTPLVCFGVENLRDLVGPAGIVVAPQAGPSGLVDGISSMLADPRAYASASSAGRRRAERHRPDLVARRLLRALR